MQTKQDLLTKMAALRACYEATTWVTSQEGTALEIGLRSNRIDWFVWLIGRIDPVAIAGFARRCADRAETYANAAAFSAYDASANAARAARAATYAYAYAATAAADATANAANAANATNAARAAADAYAYAAAAYDHERRTQLTDLHAMWTEITKGVARGAR